MIRTGKIYKSTHSGNLLIIQGKKKQTTQRHIIIRAPKKKKNSDKEKILETGQWERDIIYTWSI